MHDSSLPVIPYWRLSGFYGFYFATVGAFMPYWGPYLKSLNFSAMEIGICLAIMMGTKVVAPYLWGHIADHLRQRILIIRLAAFMALLVFSSLLFIKSFVWLALVMVVYTFFWNAALPQFEVLTLNYLDQSHHRYSRIRIWGSIGFIITVMGMGPVLDRLGYGSFPVLVLILFCGMAIMSLTVPEYAEKSVDAEPAGSIFALILQPHIQTLMLACFLMQFSHAPYYTFFSIYLGEHHFSGGMIGFLWAVGVVAEIVVFIYAYQILPVFSHRSLLLLCFAATAVRWVLIAYCVNYTAVLLFAQLLHALTFGVFHIVMIDRVRRYFSGRYHGRGQALYSGVSYGAGAAAGAYASGYAWNEFGARFTFDMASTVALAGLLIVFFRLGFVGRFFQRTDIRL